jgi:hypothetical protein
LIPPQIQSKIHRICILMKSRNPLLPAACALLLAVCTAQAVGVAALKEQSFHRDSSARVVVYSHILDSRGPHLRLVNSRRNVEILRTHLVDRIELPEAIPASLLEEQDIAPYRELLVDVRNFTARYSRSEPVLKPYYDSLSNHIDRFNAGEVRFEGNWMTKEDLETIREARRREFQAARQLEVENFAADASRRDQGLEKPDAKSQSSESPTELSEAIEPLWNGDLQGAKFAVQNLTLLASHQSGAPKVRTERLLASVRNLFLAEARVTQRIIASTAENHAAAVHDRNAKKWLTPNRFGTIHPGIAQDSHRKAAEIRQKSATEIAACRQALLEQLHEIETVTQDFLQLSEPRVGMILKAAARAVGGRHFTAAEFPAPL